MEGIYKAFSKVEVLKGVDLKVNKGEIHALLGENGAGKSTLMNILGGVLRADAGTTALQGEKQAFLKPGDSKEAGISFIHQELNVISDLTIYENLYLGKEATTKGLLNTRKMIKETQNILDKMDVALDPKTYVRDLDTSYKQIVEIAKALLEDSKIIIMDEPTTSLTDNEISNLMKLMKSLKASGVSIIYISHKLKEVLHVCDRYSVLRNGEFVGSGSIRDTDEEQITKLMVGKELAKEEHYTKRPIGSSKLRVENFSDGTYFRNISFDARAGEVLGFTGLSGDGRSELFETIFGFRKQPSRARIMVNGKPVKIKNPGDAIRAKIGLVPKNRKENAIIKDMSVMHNMSVAGLDHFLTFGFIQSRKEKSKFQAYREKLNIKVSDPNYPITNLSGGNQQKVVLAKWLEVNTDIIILDNPTQGIDVGAKSEIYHLIQELAEQGKAIIVLSTEVPELQKICDRLLVMYQGEIAAELGREEITEETILLHATGSKREEYAYG
nr:sugar ABC transporter ATP-binding protein [Salsuginibacillus kocurii]